jgi:hypothetical protein
MGDWVIASENDWCFRTFNARWPYVAALAFTVTLLVGVVS